MNQDPVLWNMERCWEHLCSVLHLSTKDGRVVPEKFLKELERVMEKFSGLKGLYFDLGMDAGQKDD